MDRAPAGQRRMPDRPAIAARLADVGPQDRPRLTEVRHDLATLFGAEPAPLDLMTDEDYENDERVLAGHESELWSITDPQTLKHLADDEEQEHLLPAEEARRDLAAADEVQDRSAGRYTRTLIEHGAGLRTSVLLQWSRENPEHVAALVDYGVLGTGILQRYRDAWQIPQAPG